LLRYGTLSGAGRPDRTQAAPGLAAGIVALPLGLALDGAPGIHALAADTDGVDGAEDVAGAFLGPDTLARAWARGMRPRDSLDDNDGHGFFGALGDALVTGPTLTNVNDFRAILLT
jgi:hydroxypyruvate reductase